MQKEELTRRISTDDDFMNYNTNDILYIYLRCNSTVRVIKEGEWREYILIDFYNKHKKDIMKIIDVKSVRTVDNQKNKLIEAGLLKEGIETVVNIDGESYEYPVYYFPYDKNGTFEWINKDLLKRIVYSLSTNAIRIFVFLYSKFLWKQKTGEYYFFTKEELKKALGYATTYKKVDEEFEYILTTLQKLELINYNKEYVMRSVGTKQVPSPIMKLTHVAKIDPVKNLQHTM